MHPADHHARRTNGDRCVCGNPWLCPVYVADARYDRAGELAAIAEMHRRVAVERGRR